MDIDINKQDTTTSTIDIKEWLIDHYIRKAYTIRDVCKALSLSKRSVEILLKKHNIPIRKVGRRHPKKKDERLS